MNPLQAFKKTTPKLHHASEKLFCAFLALCLLLSMLPQTAWAEGETETESEEVTVIESTNAAEVSTDTTEESSQTSGTCGENLTWTLDSDGTLTISGTGEMSTYSWGNSPWYDNSAIRTVVIEDGVTNIGQLAFQNCSGLTDITLPDSITAIEGSAFSDCTSLANITLPSSLTSIGYGVFYGCTGLTGIVLPDSVTSMGKSMFSDCTSLTDITLPEGITSIEPWTFENCTKLTNISIPDGVTSIGKSAFSQCSLLKSITIPDGVTSIGDYAFQYCTGLTDVVLPDSVTSIGSRAFADCTGLTALPNLKNVTYFGAGVFSGTAWYASWYASQPDGLIYIGNIACGYKGDCPETVVLQDGTTAIGGAAFSNYENLTAIVIPSGVQSIGDYAFEGCSNLVSVNIPDSVTYIGSEVFSYCNTLVGIWVDSDNPSYSSDNSGVLFNKEKTLLIKAPNGLSGDYTFPSSVTEMTEAAFKNCIQLSSLVLSENLLYIPADSFSYCAAATIHIPNGVQEIGANAFLSCSNLTELDIPDSVTYINGNAFAGCTGLTSVTLPKGIKTITTYSFNDCTNLTAVTIPDNITMIQFEAFSGCTGLEEITFQGNAPSISHTAFEGVTATAYYPADDETWTSDVMQNYGGTITWVAYSDAPEIVESGTCGDNLTWALDSEGTLTISGTGEMWEYDYGPPAWYGDNRICTLIIEEGVTSITGGTFGYCTNITNIVLPDSLTSIGSSAFNNCSSLTQITIPDNVTTIDNLAFSHCSSLESVTIPETVKTIGYQAFGYDSALVKILFCGNSPEIDETAFENVTAAAYYPESNSTWNSDMMQDYNGSIAWVGYKYTPTIYDSGTCGDLTWERDSTATLIISGNGAMPDYEASSAPWSGDYVKKIVIGNGVANVGNWAFSNGWWLDEVILPDSITCIGNCAFYSSSLLKSISIPDSVTQIGSSAFTGCDWLTGIWVGAGNPAYSSDSSGALYNKEKTYLLRVPGGLTGGYTLPDTVAGMEERAIEGCGSLTGIWVGLGNPVYSSDTKGVLFNKDKTQLLQAPGALAGNYEVPESVVNIGDYAFADCQNLTGIALPYGVQTLGDHVFYNCMSLTAIHIPNSVTGIGKYTFSSCAALAEISLPNSIDAIPESMFLFTESLKEVMIPNGVTMIKASAFSLCAGLEKVTIPASVTCIEKEAFANSGGIHSVIFLGDAPTFGESVFAGISTTVYYPANNSTWTADIMKDYGSGTVTWVAMNVAGIYENGVEKQSYGSLAEALADYTGSNQYIKLTGDLSVDFALASDLYIDLNGYDLSGVITLNGYQVYGMDSTTNSYACDSIGYFNCVDEMGEVVVPELHWRSDVTGSIKRYLRIGEDAGYSFHRFYMGITATSIKPATDSVGYKAVFAGDEMVRNYIDTYGYSIRLGTNAPIKAEKEGSLMQSGKAVTLRIDGYDVENYGEAKLTARTFITVDGETIYSTSYTSSLRDMLEQINEQAGSLTAGQLAALKEMLERYSVMQTWNVENLL